MALTDQINKIACGASGLLGTGNAACTFDWDRIVAIEFTQRAYRYQNEVNLLNTQNAILNEDSFIVKGFESFALQAVEPTISTSEGSGLKTVDGELPYEYKGTIRYKGFNFWKALKRFNSNGGVYNVAFYDVQGNKIFTETKAGDFKGFATQMIYTGQYKGKEGNTPAQFDFTLQLSNFKEMEAQVFIKGDDLDFGLEDIDGVNDIILTAHPLAAAATSLIVDATLIDKTHFASGMTTADFIVKKNGVVVTHTAATANEGDMTYTLTIPAAATGTYTVQTYDSTTQKNVVLIDGTGVFYKSNEASVIVT